MTSHLLPLATLLTLGLFGSEALAAEAPLDAAPAPFEGEPGESLVDKGEPDGKQARGRGGGGRSSSSGKGRSSGGGSKGSSSSRGSGSSRSSGSKGSSSSSSSSSSRSSSSSSGPSSSSSGHHARGDGGLREAPTAQGGRVQAGLDGRQTVARDGGDPNWANTNVPTHLPPMSSGPSVDRPHTSPGETLTPAAANAPSRGSTPRAEGSFGSAPTRSAGADYTRPSAGGDSGSESGRPTAPASVGSAPTRSAGAGVTRPDGGSSGGSSGGATRPDGGSSGGSSGGATRPDGGSSGGSGGTAGNHQRNPGSSGGSGATRPSGGSSGGGSQATRPSGGSSGSNAHRPSGGGGSSHAHRPSSKDRPHRAAHTPRPPAARPGHVHHRVVHRPYVPPRWSVSYHRYHMHGTPHWHPRYWSAGVFIYNPPPARHTVVVVDGDGGQVVEDAPAPSRAVDRNGDLAIGVSAGSYGSAYDTGGGYGDMGLGLGLEWRPTEALGLDLAYSHHSENWEDDSERVHDLVQGSMKLYAFPWTRVSPFVSGGLTLVDRDLEDTFYDGFAERTVVTEEALFGPHVGLGIQFGIGQSAALDFEGRYIGFLNVEDDDPSVPGAVQGTMGLKVYF